MILRSTDKPKGNTMNLTPPNRTPEQGHTKACLASAMISAIQNMRDAEGFSDFDFRIAVQDNMPLQEADEYLATGLQTCTCPPL